VKTFDEMNLKTKKFAEVVFGILIIEDLAAILMLVGLTNIITSSQIGGMELFLAAGKLAVVIGGWFLIGIFIVPRVVKSVDRHGNDEMLTIVSIALCLLLVGLAAYFNYSVALGAFIMGSILAESIAAKRIEHLVKPIKDVFGAVFFVSVGMLLDPQVILQNFGTIGLISVVIIVGQLFFVTVGSFITGQSIGNSVRTGFSMAQVGEFSYIIGSLGITYRAIDEKLYPIIVAASLITIFTTPYLVRLSTKITVLIERRAPTRVLMALDHYTGWVQRLMLSNERRQAFYRGLLKLGLNAIVVITLFTVAADQLVTLISNYITSDVLARSISWALAFILSSPSIWGMLSAFRAKVEGRGHGLVCGPKGGRWILSSAVTIALVAILSTEYFSLVHIFSASLVVYGILFLLLRRQIDAYYQWIEAQFKSGFQADALDTDKQKIHAKLAPWDAHLVELRIPSRSLVVGQSLASLQLRERYGVNIVTIIRDGENIVAPNANEILYPGDRVLCFATDTEIEKFEESVRSPDTSKIRPSEADEYKLQRVKITDGSPLKHMSIRSSGIGENFGCIVVGMERSGDRIRSPKPDLVLVENDILWIAGGVGNLERLSKSLG
jgi:CPA2 family monovalent cation:H+ antiporter-2